MENEERSKFTAFLVWSCITMFYCYQSVLRPLPNIIMPEILSRYGIGAAEFGSYAGIYYIGYIAVHIPIGILLSRFGAKLIIPICIALTAIGLVPLIYLDSWSAVYIGRILTGVGSSAAAIGSLQIFRILYPAKFSAMLGAMVSLGLLTTFYSSIPLNIAIESFGLNNSISLLLYAGLILALITYFLLPKSVSETSRSEIWSDIKAIIFNYKLLLASLFAGLMIGPLEGFADAWGSSFMISIYGLEKTVADKISFSVFLGMCAGCIILPYIADRTRLFFGVTIFSGFIMLGCMMLILNGAADINNLIYICIIMGIFCAYQVVIIPKIATFVSEERSGMAGAAANMILMTFGWVYHNAIGKSLDFFGSSNIDGVKSYTAEALTKSISIIPMGMLVGIVGLILMVIANIVHARLIKKSAA